MSHPDYKNIGSPEDRVVEEAAELIFELTHLIKSIQKAKRFRL